MRTASIIQGLLYNEENRLSAKQVFDSEEAAQEWAQRNFTCPENFNLYVRAVLRRPSLRLNDWLCLRWMENPNSKKADREACIHWSLFFYGDNGYDADFLQWDGQPQEELIESLMEEMPWRFAVLRCRSEGMPERDMYAGTLPGHYYGPEPPEPNDPEGLRRLTEELVREEQLEFTDPAAFVQARLRRGRANYEAAKRRREEQEKKEQG